MYQRENVLSTNVKILLTDRTQFHAKCKGYKSFKDLDIQAEELSNSLTISATHCFPHFPSTSGVSANEKLL